MKAGLEEISVTCALLAVFLFVTPGHSSAEFWGSVLVEGLLDTNAPRTPGGEGDYATQVSPEFRAVFRNGRVQIEGLYDGSVTVHHTYSDLNSQNHYTGLTVTRQLPNSCRSLSLGGSFSAGLFDPLYKQYDDRTWNGFAGLSMGNKGSSVARAAYRITSRHYPNASAFSSLDQDVSITVGSAVPHRTSISFDGDIGYRRYNSAEPPSLEIGDRMGGTTGSWAGIGAGPGMGVHSTVGQSLAPRTANQLVVAISVSQSLSDESRLKARCLYRTNLSHAARTPGPSALGDLLDNGLFNDRYTYSGVETTTGLVVMVPLGIQIDLDASYSVRDYVSSTRRDARAALSMGVSKRVPLTAATDILVNTDISRRLNSSNLSSFSYHATAVSAGLAAEF